MNSQLQNELQQFLQGKKQVNLKVLEKRLSKEKIQDGQSYYFLGIAYVKQGALEKAQKALIRADELVPDTMKILCSLLYVSTELAVSWQQKKHCWLLAKKLAALGCNDVKILYQLGRFFASIGMMDSALKPLQRGYFLGLRDADFMVVYSDVLAANFMVKEALRVLGMCPPEPAVMLKEIELLMSLGDSSQALEKIQSLTIGPEMLENSSGLIVVQQLFALGQKKQGLELLAQHKVADHPKVLRLKAQAQLLDNEEVSRLKDELIVAKEPLTEITIGLLLQLAAKYFKKSDPDSWLKAVLLANQEKKKYASEFNEDYSVLFSKIKKQYSEIDLPVSHCQDQSPIFILGMPRTGSTLVETILSAHSEVNALGETNLMNYMLNHDYEESWPPFNHQFHLRYLSDMANLDANKLTKIADKYLKAAQQMNDNPGSRFTDKMLHNFLHLGLLVKIFPRAKFILCEREPVDVCLSIMENNFSTFHCYKHTLEEMGDYYLEYAQLMEFWREIIPQEQLFVNQYEDLVADPEMHISALLNYLELDWQDAVLKPEQVSRAVTTASVAQVRQGIYKTESKHWQGLQEYLKPLTDKLTQLKK